MEKVQLNSIIQKQNGLKHIEKIKNHPPSPVWDECSDQS